MGFTGLEKVGIAFLSVAAFYVAKQLYRLFRNYCIGPMVNKVDFKSQGRWALVTGCTDGIGKEYALQLAAVGCDIVLVSRNMDKLHATAQEIQSQYKVNTKVVLADFTSNEDIFRTIAQAIQGLEIGTLVNNVGISYPYPEYFLDLPNLNDEVQRLIKANIVALTRMAAMVMPGMVQREKGVIINIGSASSCIPSPLLTVYAATKAYVDKFSEGLGMEYSKKGITVQCIMPGFVCSNMSGIKRSTFFAPSAKDFVKSALKTVGTHSRTTGYFPHTIFVTIINGIFGMCSHFGVWLITRTMENTRMRALKKYKRQ